MTNNMDSSSTLPQDPRSGPTRSGRRATNAFLGVIALAAVVIAIVLVLDRESGDDTTDTTAAPSTAAQTTSTVPSSEPATTRPSTTAAPTTAAPTTSAATTMAPSTTAPVTVPPADLATAVWPWADSTVRYTDPVEAARGFAVDFIGFTDPIIGEFLQGDSRSGEVEVKSIETFTPTTVFVRQLGSDGTWWVLGSATANVEVSQPTAGQAIASPLTVSGRSSAWEGTVNVEIRADGTDEPIFTGFVTGGGAIDGLGPFEEVFDWPNPGAGSGAIVFQTTSSDDGRIFEAGVIRVSFAQTPRSDASK